MNTSESNFNKINAEGISKIDILKMRYSLEAMSKGDKVLATSILFKQLNKKLDEHDNLMTRFKEYVKMEKTVGFKEPIAEEFLNISLKECVHNSLRSMLEEIIQIHESHHKKNYLAKVSQWYNK
jgi:small-conductance mechanosensitive channel